MSKIELATIGKDYRTEATIGDFEIAMDEPEENGGGNTAPTPSNLLAASLAGCTAITLRMYINRKEWPFRDIKVEVEKSQSEDPELRYRLDVDVKVPDADEEQLKKLGIIAKKCPVHMALHAGNDIRVNVHN